jgi:hypothetical protein
MQADPAQALVDRQAIQETLYRYCRGVDRMDRALTRDCWHADGSADYRGMFTGDVDALLDWMWKLHGTMQTHSHVAAAREPVEHREQRDARTEGRAGSTDPRGRLV